MVRVPVCLLGFFSHDEPAPFSPSHLYNLVFFSRIYGYQIYQPPKLEVLELGSLIGGQRHGFMTET